MSSSNPPARGLRIHWGDLPNHVRAAIEERIGGRVVEAVTQPGGFSPGLAARLRTSDGRRCFVKAVSEQVKRSASLRLNSPGMTAEEKLLELVESVMRGNRPMTDAEIVRAIHRRATVVTDARRVRNVLKSDVRRFVPVGSRFNFFRRGIRWRLVEAGPADDPGNAGAPVPAWPYRPSMSGAAAVPLNFREDEPPTNAFGRLLHDR